MRGAICLWVVAATDGRMEVLVQQVLALVQALVLVLPTVR